MMLALFVLLAISFLLIVILGKTYAQLPLKELRRRARHDKHYDSIYKAASFDPGLSLILYLKGGLIGLVLVIWLYKTAWWLALAGVLTGIWLALWQPDRASASWQWQVARRLSPPLVAVLSFMRPVLVRLQKLWPARPASDTKLYDREDLLELLARQKTQADGRISEAELKIVHGALSFGEKLVGSIMTDWDKVKKVVATDSVGPHLMDELHKSSQTRFPVVKDLRAKGQDEILGTLYLKDLVDYTAAGKVRSVMRPKANFINEAQNLRSSLEAFIKSQNHLLIVVNNFEEVVGVLSIEDVLKQIIGEPVLDEFESYDDLHAVARREAKDKD